MKTQFWQFDGYGDPLTALHWREETLPEPAPGQALVRLNTIGMNRSEYAYVRGEYLPASSFPSGLGQEAVGEIVALGAPHVSRYTPHPRTPLSVGARVALIPGRIDWVRMGAYRTYGLFDQASLAPLPANYSNAEGAGFWMALITAAGCLLKAGFTPTTAHGKRLLVTAAASSVGIMALKLARAWGAETIATTRSAAKAGELKSFADHVVVCDDSATLAAGVKEATGGRGVDISLDPVGRAFYPGLIEASARGAHIVSYEMLTGRETTLPITTLMLKDLTLHGFVLYHLHDTPALIDQLIDLGMNYADAARPIVAGSYPLSEAPAALQALAASNHLGKLVLDV